MTRCGNEGLMNLWRMSKRLDAWMKPLFLGNEEMLAVK